MRFIDLFSGIGGFRLGMTMAGHKPVGWCEIDKFAQKSYKAMYNCEEEWFADDIRTVNPSDLPKAECWCGGFPCQAFSIAGKRRGFEDMRGTLIFEMFRLAQARKPQVLFLENVKGLLNHDRGRTFATILVAMDELGYDAEWQLLNSKDFGVPQNRERVFIIGNLRGTSTRKVFPITKGNSGNAEQVQEKKKEVIPCLTTRGSFRYDDNSVFVAPTFTAGGNSAGYHSQTLWLVQQNGLRRLTPREAFRLQGFPDEYFERAAKVNSDAQLYKQAGNSVTVPVIYEIAKRLS